MDGNESDGADPCRADWDCSDYFRCLDLVCTVPPAVLGHSDARTPTVEFIAGDQSRGRFFVELARDRYEKMRGLSHRPSMARGWGMLFLFQRSVHYPFNMVLMRFPLDMIFIGNGGLVVDIIEDAQPKVRALVSASAYRYVLELNAGAVRAHGIRVGDRMKSTGIPEP